VILHTGSLTLRKRPLEVIAAFGHSAVREQAVLVFAGDGPLLEQCREAAKEWQNVIFLGHRSDLPDLLGAADVLVSSSASEGLPMALLEACACGLKVLASDIQPHRDIAALFPEQVSLFPLEGDGALTQQLNILGHCQPGGRSCPATASLQMISAERMSRLYQDLYDRALSRGSAVTQH
jgi:glycosyltransferase involved in cell wall biosynthesis